ncbi:hypothetical protein Tco_0806585 [Tanacetum coccineum]
MNPQETQQVVALDEKWVPSAERVKISFTNIRLETTVPQKEETFQVVINIIKNSTCFKAFTISADVPEIFMQQFWYTINKVQDTDSYEFLLANKKCTVNAEVFRIILNICPRVEGVDFTDVLDDDTALTFLIDLGYKDPLNRHPNMFVDHTHQPWRTLAVIINNCLFGKIASNDKLRKSKIDILWGMFNRENVDYPELILEDFAYQIDHRKENRSRRSKGKKTVEESKETIDVSEESEPKTKPAKKKTSSKRRVKKKVTLSADDNIISNDPDVALEVAKSISQTEAEEAKAARKVHVTHARIMTESIPESAKNNSGGRSSKSVVIQDTLSTSKSKPATSKTKLKGTEGSKEGTSSKSGVLNASTIISTTSSEGTGTKSGVPDKEKDINKEKDDKDGDADDEGDDHVSDIQDADDEDVETKSDEDDIYKYKIRVRKDEDVEMKDVEVEESDKGEEKVTNVAKEEAEKTSKAKNDTKKTKLSPSINTIKDSIDKDVSSLLDIHIQHETSQTHSPSVQKISVLVIPETTNLPPIPEITSETQVLTVVPSPQVTPIILTMQQIAKPIPTPPIITDALTVTNAVPESNALTVVELRVAKLEKDMSELKTVDHSSEALAHLPELTKKPTPTAKQESKKIPSEILKIKKEQAENENVMDKEVADTVKDHKRKHDDDEDDDDKDALAGPNHGKKTKRRRTKESESYKNLSFTKENPKGKAPTKGSKTGKSA